MGRPAGVDPSVLRQPGARVSAIPGTIAPGPTPSTPPVAPLTQPIPLTQIRYVPPSPPGSMLALPRTLNPERPVILRTVKALITGSHEAIPPEKAPNIPKALLDRVGQSPWVESLNERYTDFVDFLYEILDHPERLTNVMEADKVLNEIADKLVPICPPLAVFAKFYGGIVTVNVSKAVHGEFETHEGSRLLFKDNEFMETLPSDFAYLYVHALYHFLVNPGQVERKNPAWYASFIYAFQDSPYALIQGALAICAHIIEDLGVGIEKNILRRCRQKHPEWADKSDAFIAQRLLDTDDPEMVAWLMDMKSDHDAIGVLLREVTPDVLHQFVTEWKDPMTRMAWAVDRFSNDTEHPMGPVVEKYGFRYIDEEREMAWQFMIRLLQARTIEDPKAYEAARAKIVQEMRERSKKMAKALSLTVVELPTLGPETNEKGLSALMISALRALLSVKGRTGIRII